MSAEIRLWVDDLRLPPEGWIWAESSGEALAILRGWREEVVEISLDHDLGEDDTTRPIVLWMAEHHVWPRVVRVHTANPVGRDWLVGMVVRYGPGVRS